jgi:succinate-acetate transporter protein
MSGTDVKPEAHTRIVLRPIGSALPLGFYAFAVGMALIGSEALGFLPASDRRAEALVLLGFVTPLELLATVLAFLARDTLGGTTLGLFGASWLTLGLTTLAAPDAADTLAVFLFAFSAVVVLLAILSARAKPFFTVLLGLAASRQVLAGVGEIADRPGVVDAAGVVAFVLAVVALYGGTALALEDALQREGLPLFRRGAAEAAFQGYPEQLARLGAESGVRQQL